jgi:hypothetical protein
MHPKKFIEDTLEGVPGGVQIILEEIHQHTEERLLTRKTLFFVMSPGAGSTRPGDKFPTELDKVGVRFVSPPDVVSKYFQQSNIIDKHNQENQFELHLVKCWVTHDPYFWLHTTLLGMTMTDCWKLAHYHSLFTGRRCSNFLQEPPQSMTNKKIAGILLSQYDTKRGRRRRRGCPDRGIGHKMHPKKFIENTLEGVPGGVQIILEEIHQHTEERLLTRKTLLFVMSPGAGSTRPGDKFPTELDKVGVRFVSPPDIVSKYFQQSNIINKHNQENQFELI